MTTLSVVDIGSNSIHFMVAAIEPSGIIHELARHREQVRLGAATARTGRIDDASWAMALQVVARCQQLAARWEPTATLITATSAVREAKNGTAFLAAVQEATGLVPRLLSGEEEAALTGLAIACSSARNYQRFIDIDIGGGSTEIGIFERGVPQRVYSLPLGAVRLSELYVRNAPLSSDEYEALSLAVDQALAPVVRNLDERMMPTAFASSGTAFTLGRLLAMEQGDYDIQIGYTPQFQEFLIDRERLRALNGRLRGMTIMERIAAGVNPPRSDTIIAGGLVLERAMDALNIPFLLASAWALREGVLLEWLRVNLPDNPLVSWVQGPLSDQQVRLARRQAVQAVLRRFRVENPHAQQVEKLVTRLYAQLAPLHGLGEQEAEWVAYAALLHDIGYTIGHSAHHKHALYLIKHSELPGFSPEEIAIIANIARYHRKALPQMRHADYAKLPPESRETVRKLAAILRLADALDRGHSQVVRDVDTTLNGQDIVITLQARKGCELERWACEQKQDLFVDVFGKKVKTALAKR